MARAIQNQDGMWVFFIAPINKLILTPAIKEEIRINQIIFVSCKKLPRIRKRLGLSYTIGELKKKWPSIFNSFFDNKTFAIWKIGGNGSSRKKKFIEIVKKELDIISLSQLMYGKRKLNSTLSISKDKAIGSISYLMLHQNQTMSKDSYITSDPRELHLDGTWKDFHSFSFFFNLLKVLRKETVISKGWLRDISSAAYMAGQSQATHNLPQAFLWNMIAIETLLTHRDDSYSKELPLRAEAFIGWTEDWSNSNIHEEIGKVYKKRCSFVHGGIFDQITIKDIEFTDNILFNIFYNILKHLTLFKDKNSLIEFSEKVQAEKKLGIKSQVRPKTFKYTKRGN
jgi:hypothetical protein